MKRAFFIVVTLTLISCREVNKDDQKVSSYSSQKELIVKLSFKTDTEDVFKISMNNIEVDEFQKKNIMIRETIPVTTNFESITAKFGQNNFSKNIQIHLGRKPKTVKFNKVKLAYGKNILLINDDNFNEFLGLNKFTKFDESNFSIKTKNEDSNKYNPVIFLKPKAIQFLKKEI